jgi:hypothetical protein
MPLALLANALLGFTLRKKIAFNKANFHHILIASFNVVAIIINRYGAKGQPCQTPL